jgi:hypothetical protein
VSGRAASGAEDYRMLLTVIAGISLGVAATALPVLIEGPYGSWVYAAKVMMWCTGVAAGVLEYLAVAFGSRLYLIRVEVFATTSLALVFLAQAGLFVVLTLDRDDLLVPRWITVFAFFCVFSALEAHHARRKIARHAGDRYPADAVEYYARSLRQVVLLILITGVVALLIAILGRSAPGWLLFVFALLAFAAIVVANVQQERSRNELATYGVLPTL